MVRLINCRLQFPSLLQAEQAWSSQPLLLHAVPQPPDQPGAPLSNWDWAPNSALLVTFQPGGNLSCPLVPAALHKPHVVVSHSIFTPINYLAYLPHGSPWERKNIFTRCWCGFQLRGSRLLVCLKCLFVFCTRGSYWFHLFLSHLCSIPLFLFPFLLTLDARERVILCLRYSQGPVSLLCHAFPRGW